MQRETVKLYAILVTLLAIGGLYVSSGHLFGLMNADPALDWLRVVLAVFLLYVGFRADDARLVRGSLLFIGALYVGMGILGLLNTTLWGLLPSGLTGFDIVFHLVTGITALGVASSDTRHATAHH